MVKTIAHIENATNESVGPFKIKNVLPVKNIKQVNPFLLIHHMQPFMLHYTDDGRIPPHPHAGFEVVTYLLQGDFFHKDSKGYNQIATGGDVNWMTSGSGIVHSEGPAEAFLKNGGGKIELLQIWINLPAEKKKLEPSFKHYISSSFPVIENEELFIKVIMGEYATKQSPINTHTPLFLYHLKIKQDTIFELPVKENNTTAIYVMNGQLKISNNEIVAGQLVDFNSEGNKILFTASANTELIIFGGEPINEKVVSYGPFVMNSLEEIQHAITDYEAGKMGVLAY